MILEEYLIYNQQNNRIQPFGTCNSGNNHYTPVPQNSNFSVDSTSFGMKERNINLYVTKAKDLIPGLSVAKDTPKCLSEAIKKRKPEIDAALKVFKKDKDEELKEKIIKMMLGIDEYNADFCVPYEIYSKLTKSSKYKSLSQVRCRKLCDEAVDTFCKRMGTQKVHHKSKFIQGRLSILSPIFNKNFEEVRTEDDLTELMNRKNSKGKTMKDIINMALFKFDTTDNDIAKEKRIIEGLLNLKGKGYVTMDDLSEELNICKTQIDTLKGNGTDRIIRILKGKYKYKSKN